MQFITFLVISYGIVVFRSVLQERMDIMFACVSRLLNYIGIVGVCPSSFLS